jgi:myo-inositol-1(or 4)-monophosphatase
VLEGVPKEWRSDLELAYAAALAAGDVAMGTFGTVHQVSHKAPGQPVTPTDREIDLLLHHRLLGGRPEYGWLSEEIADSPDRLTYRRVWIVDPIDGTRAFIDGEREFSISIGLLDDGQPRLGIVHAPALGETLWAVRGAGAWWGSLTAARRVQVRPLPGEGERFTALASRSDYRSGRLAPLDKVARITAMGSTAYKLARVAAGREHAYVTPAERSEWDVCAGALLVEEAGGVISDGRGAPLAYNGMPPHIQGVVAAGPGLQESILAAFGA